MGKYRTLSFMEYPKYRVGKDGSFWRWTVIRGWTRRKVNSQGIVSLCRDGVVSTHRVANLILRAFVGPPMEGQEACHYPDPDVTNNNLTNLRWDSHEGNMMDRRKHGREATAKITTRKAAKLRTAYATGAFTMRELGDFFGLRSLGTVHHVIHGKTWCE